MPSTTKISLSDISKELELHRALVQNLRKFATRYVEGLTTDVVRGTEPAVRNVYMLRNATIIEACIDGALKDIQSAIVFAKTFQQKEVEDAD